jgi:hypothetical protein
MKYMQLIDILHVERSNAAVACASNRENCWRPGGGSEIAVRLGAPETRLRLSPGQASYVGRRDGTFALGIQPLAFAIAPMQSAR